jgi:DNA-binding NarL/FixJ family response regulator
MKRLPDDAPTALARPDLRVPDFRVLSQRELEVVRLLATQMSTTQIAAALSISVNTVRARVRGALRKLGVDDREKAAQTARDRGLV